MALVSYPTIRISITFSLCEVPRRVQARQPTTSGIADLQWQLDFGYWGDRPKTLSGDECEDIGHLFDVVDDLGCDYHDVYSREDPSFEPSRPIEAHYCSINIRQEGSNLSQLSPPISIDHFVEWQPPELFLSIPDSFSQATSAYEAASPSASSVCNQTTSQSTTPSPASSAPQLSCDFCGKPFSTVDYLCNHIIVDHVQSAPFHCASISVLIIVVDAGIRAGVTNIFVTYSQTTASDTVSINAFVASTQSSISSYTKTILAIATRGRREDQGNRQVGVTK
ncbi:unnamed protein product [Fusarium venenatum]|uniref:C2H2-type domain-containing protein n=1 Tax=Fusarium venenatum TaxID=56646 RepID=A0A2L2TE20_9HYPO|nr:uncharacterized protein FVRRES_08296 [Fusarium venenatum]CEI68219.1 unnamed protein product [Fusarium venenatum]